MKIVCLQEQLARALATVSKATPNKPVMPITSCALLEATDRLRITATDLTLTVDCQIDAKVGEQGKVVVPAKMLSSIVASMPKDVVTLESTDNQLKVSCRGIKSRLSVMLAADFPSVSIGSTSISFPAEQFKAVLSRLLPFVAVDLSRPVLTGIYMSFADGFLTMVSCDGYRVGYGRIPCVSENREVIVPSSCLTEVLASIKEGEVGCGFDGNSAVFSLGSTRVKTSLLQGPYVEWKRTVPAAHSTKVVVETQELLDAFKTISVIAKAGDGITRMKVRKDRLELNTSVSELGDTQADVSSTLEGNEMRVALRNEYVIDYLSVVGTEKTTLELSGETKPVVIRVDADNFAVIAPMKVTWEDSEGSEKLA